MSEPYLARVLASLAEEVEALETAVPVKQHTHASGCWAWGKNHYDCAMLEIHRMRRLLEEKGDWK